MIWFTWRQFRTQAWITAGGLVILAVILAITGHHLADLYQANVGDCHSNCGTAIDNFISDARNSIADKVLNYSLAIMYVVPGLIGIFWGAPLIARELETGTYRLAFSQSVTRTRWLATKLATVAAVAMASVGLISWAVTAWAHHIDHANDNRLQPLVFGARDIVPIGYAAFAFAIGVTAGMLIRRTVPAMAATLAVYVGAVASMPFLRSHLLPASHTTLPLTADSINEIAIRPGGVMTVTGGSAPHGAWVLTNQTINGAGNLFTGPADPQHCGGDGPDSCIQWLGSLGLRQDFTYQPASHFWPLQWTETGMFLAVALLLVGFCFWWTRRRLT
jgi:ABC-type transport system involved in multi-copper enzyme maturation permease subunit